ncbi:MAG: alpha/beta fold hydrolase [Mycobacteriales bacterium]
MKKAPRFAVVSMVAMSIAMTVTPATAQTEPAKPNRYSSQQLAWQPCTAGSPLLCAPMTVPSDWHHPGKGPDITVEVSRLPASKPSTQHPAILMTAAGGPGGSGLKRPLNLAGTPVAAAYDVVGFDQRGVGRSTSVHCQTDQEFNDMFVEDLRDHSPSSVERRLRRDQQIANNCQARTGNLLRFVNTDQTVHDMDLFRALLGAPKISYYGPSYATMLGAYYATEFPQRVDHFVLDSNIEFSSTRQKSDSRAPLSFQRRF